jgi:hypothetical protein
MFANAIRSWNAMPLYGKLGSMILAIGIVIFGFWTLSPLFYDRRVDEAFPAPAMADQAASTAMPAPAMADQAASTAMPAMADQGASAMADQAASTAMPAMADQAASTAMPAPAMAENAAPTAMAAPAMSENVVPTAMAAPAMAENVVPTAMAAPAALGALIAGSFVDGAPGHNAQGSATIFRLEDGKQILRLMDFSATNGPDLFVVLSGSANPDQDGVKSGAFLQLDALKGNVGDQNYDLPADIDLSQYRSVVIWCRTFDVVFGYAPLQSAS